MISSKCSAKSDQLDIGSRGHLTIDDTRRSGRSLAELISQENPVAICDGIIDLLSVLFNVSGRQLRSPARTTKSVARVRQIGMYIAHVTLGLKMARVGRGFGRDKSTVVYACHTIEDLRDDEDFNEVVARAERLVTIAFSLERDTIRQNV